jgi:Na+/H+ antiporter NhaD/arsenite permease-like protein
MPAVPMGRLDFTKHFASGTPRLYQGFKNSPSRTPHPELNWQGVTNQAAHRHGHRGWLLLMQLNPAFLSDARILAAYIIFFASYFVFALGKFPGLKIDRPGAAIIGAVLMVAFRIMNAQEALRAVDFTTIVLLFSMMLIVGNLHLGGFFEWVIENVFLRLSAHQLLVAVIFTSGILSAFLVNDIVCLVMTPFVVKLTDRLGLKPVPYLLALATSSNIGSVATITGNPQNMLIGSVSHISYLNFLFHLAPIAVIGLFLDWGLVYWMYLRSQHEGETNITTVAEFQPHRPRMKPVLVLAAVLVGFLSGAPAAMVAAVGAAALLITRTMEPRLIYDEVDWGLLVFFIGLFVIVGGAERAGLTENFLRPFAAWNLHRVWIYAAVSALLSNIVSNVPAVVLLKSLVRGFPDPRTGWLALAMSSTLAGNLTITGSVANIIVVERARPDVHIGFREYFRLGLPLTVITLVLGVAWLTWVR